MLDIQAVQDKKIGQVVGFPKQAQIKPWFVNAGGEITDGEHLIAEPSYLSRQGYKNAALIAAAPELLSLLVEVVSELSDTDDEGLIEHTEWMMKARAVIAKARGV